jgi:predicted Zn-dependent peptidase
MFLPFVFALAASPEPGPPRPLLALTAIQEKLPNGMTVIVSPDHSAPGLAMDIWFQVGARDVTPGRTGFAHLFEHLMFMGSRNVPYPQFDSIMEASGGQANAFTRWDGTYYYNTGPSNLLETFFWMEADRLASVGATMTQGKLDTQREVVINENRTVMNKPYACAGQPLREALFSKGHPYSWNPGGSQEDLEAATLADVKTFFATWYVPNNATVSVVGDVEPAEVLKLAHKYFDFLPARPLPPRPSPPPASLAREKRIALKDRVKAAKLIIGWPSPAATTDGDAECELLAIILAEGSASRIYERLVHRDTLATSVGGHQNGLDLQGYFQIDAMVAPGHTLDEVQKAVDEELARMAEHGPTRAEVTSAQNRYDVALARRLENFQQKALLLAELAVHYGNANAFPQDQARYRAVTPASIQAMAKRLFVPGRVVVTVEPANEGGAR